MFTELSFVAREAETGEGVDPIQASGSIQTRVRLALINIFRHATQTSIIIHPPVRKGQDGLLKEHTWL